MNKTPIELAFVNVFDNEDYLIGIDFDDYDMSMDGSLKNFSLSKLVSPDTLFDMIDDLAIGDLILTLDKSDTTVSTQGRIKGLDYREFLTVGSWSDLGYGTGWATYANGFYNPSYKLQGGIVYLRGNAKRTSGTGTKIAGLPTGYRPSSKVRFPVITDTGLGTVQIETDGDIKLLSGGTGWVSLDGLNFSV